MKRSPMNSESFKAMKGEGMKRIRTVASLHSVECLLEYFEIAGVAVFFTARLDPFFLQRVFARAICFVKDAEHARERKSGELVRGHLVSDVVSQLVFRGVVPFLFLDDFEAPAFARVGRIEHVREKFHAFTEAFD